MTFLFYHKTCQKKLRKISIGCYKGKTRNAKKNQKVTLKYILNTIENLATICDSENKKVTL